jgi:hypothetical protein
MKWHHYIACFFAGMFIASAVPFILGAFYQESDNGLQASAACFTDDGNASDTLAQTQTFKTNCPDCDTVISILASMADSNLFKKTEENAWCTKDYKYFWQLVHDGTYSDFKNRSIDQELSDTLQKRNWQYNFQCSADGPDGTSFSFLKGDLMVVIDARWDGGDDSDSTYIPSDYYYISLTFASQKDFIKKK